MISPSNDVRRAHLAMWALMVGAALNPLNSSMIAIALVDLQHSFGLSIVTVTWVITVFYIVSTVGQPLMGRVVDAVGARRAFTVGMGVVVVAAVLAPLGGSFALVCVSRGLLAVGTSAAFPAAIALVRPLSERSGAPVPQLLGRIQVTSTAAAALGPVVGGALVTWAGWEAVFLVNVPLAVASGAGAFLLPRRAAGPERSGAHGPVPLLRALDPVGVGLFALAVTTILVAVLEGGSALWLGLVGVAALTVLVWWERRSAQPFVDVRMLARNRVLRGVYVGFALFNVLYYVAFFGLPQLLEEHAGYSAAATGLLLLPLAASTVVLAPIVARRLGRNGPRTTMRAGAVLLLVAAALLWVGSVTTEPVWMLLMAAAMGVPYCMVSLATTQSLHQAAPPEALGVASGLLQAARYVGAITATVVLGHLLDDGVTAGTWRTVVAVTVGVGVVHLVVVLRATAGRATSPAAPHG